MDRYPIKTILVCAASPAKPTNFSAALYAAMLALYDKNVARNQRAFSIGHLESVLFGELAKKKGKISKDLLAGRRAFVRLLCETLRQHEKMLAFVRPAKKENQAAVTAPPSHDQ